MTIEAGDGVTIEYVGRFEDGTIFDTSRYEVAAEHGLAEAQDADPDSYKALSFRVGNRDVIAGLDDALVGRSEGEEATITVDPGDAYGPVESEKIRSTIPPRSRRWSVRSRRSGCTFTRRTTCTAT
nr:FKBP-type peptidyl-prolyl cis-trans isomerase [Halomicroarcula sp. DFY41]